MKHITAAMRNALLPLSVLIFLNLFACGSFCQGNLLITPKRVVFDGEKRTEEINLANIGKDTATYTISLMELKMDDEGKFQPANASDSSQHSAERNIRFFPRRVTLGPNEAQSVKIQVIRKNELATGEYRSHLFFRAMENSTPLGEEQGKDKKDSVISIRITPLFGITIPVIIRVGESSSKINITNTSLHIEKDSIPVLKMTFIRSGNISTYGDIKVDFISDEGKVTEVGFVKGLAVYTPNSRRNISLVLNTVPGVSYKSGKLNIQYSDESPRPVKLAEDEIVL
ncbi:MAG: hypothetical protein ABI683_10725 [Ginsengibacter sp.]